MKRLTYWIQDYFGFSLVETKGFIVLMALLSLLLISPIFLKSGTNYTAEQFAKDQQQLDSMRVLLAQQDIQPKTSWQNKKPRWKNAKKQQKKSVKRFAFNPNVASQPDLESLGIAPFLAKRIIKYRNKGGKFYSKEDLQKIYGFPPELYNSLAPYIRIPKSEKKIVVSDAKPDSAMHQPADQQFSDKPPRFKKWVIQPFDLATADTTALKQIKGIGSKLSARIIRFRENLGGFHSLEQLHEVYGLKPEVITELQKYTSLTEPVLDKIAINSADAETLRKHPYISYKLANVIVSYRTQHGSYTELADLKKIKLVKQDFLTKIAPYLQFD